MTDEAGDGEIEAVRPTSRRDQGPWFRPWSNFLLVLALLSIPLGVGHDLGLDVFEALSEALATVDPNNRAIWLREILQRIALDVFKIALAVAIVAALFYGMIQYLGVMLDRRLIAVQAPGRFGRFIRGCTGRFGVSDAQYYLPHAVEWGLDSLLTPIRIGFSAFPMLGFIGTVVGLSGAIRSLPAAVEDRSKIDPVLEDLYVAFDTTFLGLVGALICILATRLIEAQIDALERATSS